jgi:hypothetical protein
MKSFLPVIRLPLLGRKIESENGRQYKVKSSFTAR